MSLAFGTKLGPNEIAVLISQDSAAGPTAGVADLRAF